MIPEVEKKQLMGLQYFTKRAIATGRLATRILISQKSRYTTKIGMAEVEIAACRK